MSLFSSIILPHLEREVIKLEPAIQAFLLNQLKNLCGEALIWAENKLNIDINQDGKIGRGDNEA